LLTKTLLVTELKGSLRARLSTLPKVESRTVEGLRSDGAWPKTKPYPCCGA
jgi:hypothetical protein